MQIEMYRLDPPFGPIQDSKNMPRIDISQLEPEPQYIYIEYGRYTLEHKYLK